MEDKKERLDALDTEHAIELSPEDLRFITRTALLNIVFWTVICLFGGFLSYYTFKMLDAFKPYWFKWRYEGIVLFIYLGGWFATGLALGYQLAILKNARYLIQKVRIAELMVRRIFSGIVTGAVKLRTSKGEIKDFSQLAGNIAIEQADNLLSDTIRAYRRSDFNWRTGKNLVKSSKKLILSRTKKFLTAHLAFFLLKEFRQEYRESMAGSVHLSHVEERALHLSREYLTEIVVALLTRRAIVMIGFASFVSVFFPLLIQVFNAVYIKILTPILSVSQSGIGFVRIINDLLPQLSVFFGIILPLAVFILVWIHRRKRI